MKPKLLSLLLRSAFIVFCMLCQESCMTARFEANWSDDSNFWETHDLNGVHFRVPKELPLVKMTYDTWWFIINAKNVPNFTEGAGQGIAIRVTRRLSPNDSESQFGRDMVKHGGRVSSVTTPIKGILYYVPRSYEGKPKGEGNYSGTLIGGSDFGYMFHSPSGATVWVEMFKHSPHVKYEQWHPETEIFTEKERQLVEKIAALAN